MNRFKVAEPGRRNSTTFLMKRIKLEISGLTASMQFNYDSLLFCINFTCRLFYKF